MALWRPPGIAQPTNRGQIEFPEWAYQFIGPSRYKCGYGGRGAGRTTAFARLIVLDSLKHPGAWYACCREFQSSIRVSSKAAIENAIKDMGLSHKFIILKNEIYGKNGAYFFFTGIERNPDNIRGWERVRICWVEEAERLSHQTAKVLIPTIRAEGFISTDGVISDSELWFSWNPDDRGSWVFQRFVVKPRIDDVIAFACWRDNPWFPKVLEIERRAMETEDPELYMHVWEGQPYDEGKEKRILPYGILQECVDAWHKYSPGPGAFSELGFDVADTGFDKNAAVVRSGACIMSAEEWRAKTVTQSTMRVHGIATENGVRFVSYDRQGIGAEARRTFADLSGQRRYKVIPTGFGWEVANPTKRYSYKVTNQQQFLRRNSQMAWTLRLRANNTRRLLYDGDIVKGVQHKHDLEDPRPEGEEYEEQQARPRGKVSPHKCLFINPDIPHIERYLSQLAQPKWDFSETGRIRILKKEEDEPSPDLFDATSLAYARDSRNGLRAD